MTNAQTPLRGISKLPQESAALISTRTPWPVATLKSWRKAVCARTSLSDGQDAACLGSLEDAADGPDETTFSTFTCCTDPLLKSRVRTPRRTPALSPDAAACTEMRVGCDGATGAWDGVCVSHAALSVVSRLELKVSKLARKIRNRHLLRRARR